jgi:hypothetical protein
VVDGAVEGIRLAVRGRLQQPVASQCAVRVLNKQFQQVELAGGEFVFVAVGEDQVRRSRSSIAAPIRTCDCRGGGGAARWARRNWARTRASSSAGSNGLTT